MNKELDGIIAGSDEEGDLSCRFTAGPQVSKVNRLGMSAGEWDLT